MAQVSVAEIAHRTGLQPEAIRSVSKKKLVPYTRGAKGEYLYDENVIQLFLQIFKDNPYGIKGRPAEAREIIDEDIIKHMAYSTFKAKPGIHGSGIPVNIRFIRITPAYLRCLFAYCNVTPKRFYELVGIPAWIYERFCANYHPDRNFGAQVAFQCGMFFIVTILFEEGYIPYSLARLGGVFDRVAHLKETKLIRRIKYYGHKNRTQHPKGSSPSRKRRRKRNVSAASKKSKRTNGIQSE